MRDPQLKLLRQCSLCLKFKALDDFHRRGDGYQKWCKECRREWDAAYHARTRPVRLEQKREAKQARTAWLHQVKSQPCADCKGSFHPTAMTFDHLPWETKIRDISTLVGTGCMQMAIREIAKCDLVCANCHAVRTYIRRLGIEPTRPSICEAIPTYA